MRNNMYSQLNQTQELCLKKQIRTVIAPNISTAHDARIHSNAELNNFWNGVLSTKNSDNKRKMFGNAIRSDV